MSPAPGAGERPELVPRGPARLDIRASDAVHHAEAVRAADDVETSERQQALAAGQREAAETLRETAAVLDESRAELESTGARAARNAARADSVAETAEQLGEQLSRVREQVRAIPADPVDGGDGDGAR